MLVVVVAVVAVVVAIQPAGDFSIRNFRLHLSNWEMSQRTLLCI